MVSTRNRKNQQKRRQCSQLIEISNDFVIDSKTNVSVMENGTLDSQIDGCYNIAEGIVDGEINASPSQVIGIIIIDKIRKVVDNAKTTVTNRMHEAILTAMDNVIIP